MPLIKQEVIKQEDASPPDSMEELLATEAAMEAQFKAIMQEFRAEAETPKKNVKPVERLQPSTVPGECGKGPSYTAGSCHLN